MFATVVDARVIIVPMAVVNNFIIAVAFSYNYFSVEPVATCESPEAWKKLYMESGVVAMMFGLISVCYIAILFCLLYGKFPTFNSGPDGGFEEVLLLGALSCCGLWFISVLALLALGLAIYGLIMYFQTKDTCQKMTRNFMFIVLYWMVSSVVLRCYFAIVHEIEKRENIDTQAYRFKGKMGIICDEEGVVQKVIDNEPAHKKGIAEGDTIVKISTHPFLKPKPYSEEYLAQVENLGAEYTVRVRVDSRSASDEESGSSEES